MLRSILVCAVVATLFGVSPARAQVDPTLLVLDPIGALDPAVAADVVAVAEARGYRVLRPAAGSVVGALDAASGDDLSSVVQRTGVHRAVAVWVRASGSGFDVQVGLATHDGTATSMRRSTSAESVHTVAGALLAELLPAPFVVTRGGWAPIVDVAPAVDAAPVDASAPPVERHRSDNLTLMIGGYAAFAVAWLADLVVGPFGGYVDRTCIDLGVWGGCDGLPPGTSFQPAWDDFRAASLVPIAGPWIQLAVKPESDDLWPAFLIIDGIAQGAGAILMIVGTVLFVDEESAEEDSTAPSVAVLPTFGPDGAGLRVAGHF